MKSFNFRWLAYPALAVGMLMLSFMTTRPLIEPHNLFLRFGWVIVKACVMLGAVIFVLEMYFKWYGNQQARVAVIAPHIYPSITFAIEAACKELCILDKNGEPRRDAEIEVTAGRDEFGLYLWIRDKHKRITSSNYHYENPQNHWIGEPETPHKGRSLPLVGHRFLV